jgi:hypothetical protein
MWRTGQIGNNRDKNFTVAKVAKRIEQVEQHLAPPGDPLPTFPISPVRAENTRTQA